MAMDCSTILLPQVLQYRGIPFKPKRQGLLNSSGLNEGIVQGTNFKTSVFPLQYESALERSVRTGFTGAPWLRTDSLRPTRCAQGVRKVSKFPP